MGVRGFGLRRRSIDNAWKLGCSNVLEIKSRLNLAADKLFTTVRSLIYHLFCVLDTAAS
jgi:hypothetical protein